MEHKIYDWGTGAIGVWVFFVLSGYLIVSILHRSRERFEQGETTRGRALAEFWRNRALRILPIYYAVILVVFLATHALDGGAFAYYALYVQNLYIGYVSHQWGKTTHLWSLALEQQFYLVAAPLLLFTSLRGHLRSLSLALVACIFLTIAAVPLGWDKMAFSISPPPNFAFMMLGGIVCLSAAASPWRRLLGHPLSAALSALAFLVTFAITRASYDSMGGTPLSVFFTGLWFAGALVTFVADHQDAALVRWLDVPPLRWLGTISYGFYIYHAFLPGPGPLLARASEAWHGAISLAWIGVELATALVIADLSWRLFERRFLQLKRS